MSVTEPVVQTTSEIAPIVDEQEFNNELKTYYRNLNKNSKKLEWTRERVENTFKLLDEYNTIKLEGKRPSNTHYYHARKYDTLVIGNEKVLILKRKNDSDPVVQIIPSEDYYDLLLEAHLTTQHGRRDKIIYTLKDKYVIPIFAVRIFLNLCKTCLSKKSFSKNTSAKPLFSKSTNRRGKIDLINFQACPDQNYKWLLQYQDLLTKFCFLRPLKSQHVIEVAVELLKIFLEIGCPDILLSHSKNFTASVLKELANLWPACKIVSGKLLLSMESAEQSTLDVKDMIFAWMTDKNSTNWSIGCYFVQFQKNSSLNPAIARTPYNALFGVDPKLGLTSSLSQDIISKIKTEEDLEKYLADNNTEEQNSDNDQEDEHDNLITIDIPKLDVTMIKQEVTVDDDDIYDSSEPLSDFQKNTSGNVTVKSEKKQADMSSHRNIQESKSHQHLKRATNKTSDIASKKFKDSTVVSTLFVEVPKYDEDKEMYHHMA